MRRPSVAALLLPLLLSRCGGEGAPGATSPQEDGGTEGPGPDGDGPKAPGGCRSAAAVAALSACIDGDTSPQSCLDEARVAIPGPCDSDEDGMDDALEDAMARSYAPAFAFNKGDGDHTGDDERAWPATVAHFVEHASLIWRVDDDNDTRKTVLEKPTLETLATATYGEGKATVRADSPKLGAGPNFWLCLEKPGGKYEPGTTVNSMEIARKLKGGIDLYVVAHPSGKGSTRYVVLQYLLFFPYNPFTLDNHEGDWEGGAVFVDLESGKVVAFYTDRHPSGDNAKLSPLTGSEAMAVRDPSSDSPKYNVCSDVSKGASFGGVRFWDFAGAQHHPVLYVSSGGHAGYAYPGATKITGAPGCTENLIVRDVHNGTGPKLVPQDGAFYTDWMQGDAPAGKQPVTDGVHVVNLGEYRPGRLTPAWTAFAGQWGCTLESVPKSYPGPWDNERLCRHWLTHDWGQKPPFAPSTKTSCK